MNQKYSTIPINAIKIIINIVFNANSIFYCNLKCNKRKFLSARENFSYFFIKIYFFICFLNFLCFFWIPIWCWIHNMRTKLLNSILYICGVELSFLQIESSLIYIFITLLLKKYPKMILKKTSILFQSVFKQPFKIPNQMEVSIKNWDWFEIF